jgi:hypothetical protein
MNEDPIGKLDNNGLIFYDVHVAGSMRSGPSGLEFLLVRGRRDPVVRL